MEARSLYYSADGLIEAGCDEAGRGCLAGPVVAAAVILPPDFDVSQVNDSKQLKKADRLAAAAYVKERAVAWSIAAVDNIEIDRINILKASIKAMHLAVSKLIIRPQLLLIDGNQFYPFLDIPHKCIVKGDALYASISAASVLAKTYRDALMEELHEQYPVYGWKTNAGYGTREHYNAIHKYGITGYHRRSYAPVNDYLQMQLFYEEGLEDFPEPGTEC